MSDIFVIKLNDGTITGSCYTQYEFAKTSLDKLFHNEGTILKFDRFGLTKDVVNYLIKNGCFTEVT